MSFSLEQLKDAVLGQYGALVLLMFIIYSGYKRWWVWGWYSSELKAENTRLSKRLDLLLGQTQHSTFLAEKNQEILEQVVTQRAELPP